MLPAIVMSLITFAGAAQFAAVAVIAAGGDVVAAVLAGTLINLRYVPMSVAMTPSLPSSPLRRYLIPQALTDVGWALAARSGGRFDPDFLIGSTVPQYVFWQIGTVAGVLFSSRISDPTVFGTDALYPAFFLAVLVGGELRADRMAALVAIAGGTIALVLTPIAPPGVPLTAASLAALLVFLRPRRDDRFPPVDEIGGKEG